MTYVPLVAQAFTWQPVAPELLLLVAVLLVPLLGLGMKGERGKRDLGRITAIVLAGSLFMVVYNLVRGFHLDTVISIAHEAALYEVTAFSQFLKVIFLGVALLIALASVEYAARFRNPIEYYTLLLVATAGMMVVASARDLITLFIGIETASLSSYVLAGYRKEGPQARFGVEASTKYFVIGALSSAIFLYGISLLYGIAGTVRFEALGAAIGGGEGTGPITFIAILFILVGIGFKISAAPFHMWAPDVYHGAPDTVAGFLSAGSKAMGFAAAFKVFIIGLAAVRADWDVLVAIVAIGSMTVGNIIALRQTSIKRMFAYSSVAQAGYILIAVVVASEYAIAGGLYHLVTNGVMKATVFIGVAALAAYGLGDRLADYKGLAVRNPLLAIVLTVMLLSLAGVPPLGGFVSKFALFSSAVYASAESGREWLIWLAVAGVVNSVISLFYYVRVIRFMYAEKGESTTRIATTPATTIALVAGIVLIVLLGLWPDSVWPRAIDAAASLLSGASASGA